MKIDVLKAFPTPIHKIDIDNYPQVKERMTKFVYGEYEKNPEGRLISNRGGWQSPLYHGNDTNVLMTMLQHAVSGYLGRSRLFKKGLKFYFVNSWININKKGDYNVMHIHSGCELSGIFYLKIPPNSGILCFDSPHVFADYEFACYSEEFRSQDCVRNHHSIEPKEGRMILFPPYLYHRVEPNQSDEDRISVSFNLAFKI